jgi:hypothetical protein
LAEELRYKEHPREYGKFQHITNIGQTSLWLLTLSKALEQQLGGFPVYLQPNVVFLAAILYLTSLLSALT